LQAPLVVYFGKQEIFWQCSEQFASESWPEEIPSFLYDRLGRQYDVQLNFVRSGFRDSHSDWVSSVQDQKKLRALWDVMVNFYSNCQLSFGKDKLVAVSGIARCVARYIRGNYLTGLWRTEDGMDFVNQLMWSATPAPRRWQRPILYRSLSWSWCAIDCQYKYPNPTDLRKGKRTSLPISKKQQLLSEVKMSLGKSLVVSSG
jgi:hypothetical protein